MKNCNIFLIFAQNIDSGYIEAVLTSTHNVCFRAKIRKNVYPCTPHFYYTKVGFKGVFVTRTFFRDGLVNDREKLGLIMHPSDPQDRCEWRDHHGQPSDLSSSFPKSHCHRVG